MLDLPQVTLLCLDTVNHALALRALERSRAKARFARVILATDRVPPGIVVPDGISIAPIAALRSRDDYSRYVMKELVAHVETSHVLLVQWDGYVVNPDAWDPAFLECDYLGATWFWYDDDMRVGNGGFSLRSRRLLEALGDTRIVVEGAEDTAIGRTYRPYLEQAHGIRFGSEALADRFAFEADYPVGTPFGFHGLFNFWRVMGPRELAELVPGFSDAMVCSAQFDQLMHNCALGGLWLPAAAIARRKLALDPSDTLVRALLADADAEIARSTRLPADARCPCSSGRPFGACHGAPGATSLLERPPRLPSVDDHVARGIAASRRGELASASRELRAALVLAPAHAPALHELGIVEFRRGRVADAVRHAERAVALQPGVAEYRQSLAHMKASPDSPDR